jgi:ankyrin repeat protein
MQNPFSRRNFIVTAAGGALAAARSPVLGAAETRMRPEFKVPADFCIEPVSEAETDPFRRAVTAGDADVVAGFLAKDPALLYARDAQGQSVYLLACYEQRTNVMTLLESKGLVLDVYEAAAAGKIDRLTEILRTAPGLVRVPNLAGDTPMHVAAKCGQSAAIDNMITFGPNFAQPSPKRKNATVAHIGVASANQPAAEAIAFATIGNGMAVNLATTDGDTILHCAARAGYPRVVRLLLQKGADASARNAAGQSPLDIAQSGGHAEAAALLRNAGNIERDYYGKRYEYDPKFGALKRDDTNGLPREFVDALAVVSHFSLDRVKKWIELCPDLLNTRATWDELPVEAAAHMGRPDIGGIFLGRGASYSICTATVFGSLAEVKRMLAEDPLRIHERGAHSFPLLWYTAFGNSAAGGKPKPDAAEFLIQAGADVNDDMRGRTVLHTAATSGHQEMCRYFLEKGLNPLQRGTTFLGTQDAIEAAELAKHPEVAAMLRDWVKQHPARS